MGELRLEPATLDDAAFASDVWTAARPSAPTDPLVKRYWWATESETYVSARYVVTRGGQQIDASPPKVLVKLELHASASVGIAT